MPDNPKPFIEFNDLGNKKYKPRLRKGGLTEEVINTGNLQVLRSFFNARGSQLNRDEFNYLTARIAAAEEIERLSKKAMKDLAEGREHPVPNTDTKNGFTGFSNLVYPGEQTSTNGCWSCAYSLLLKSRGVELSQEKIRAWRPDYAKTVDNTSPATQNTTYMRNADTEMDLVHDVDLLTQVLPNTAMANFTMSPLELQSIELIDPKTNAPVKIAKKHEDAIRNHHKAEVIKQLTETITRAINQDRSPVAVVVDGHYITITGISRNGRLRYEDSAVNKGEKTTYNMTIEQLYTMGFEDHEVKVDDYTKVTIEPHGISLNWLQDLKVPEYNKNQISKPDYGSNNDVISVDAEGNAKLNIPANDIYRVSGGDVKEGNVTTVGVMTMPTMDVRALEKKLGLKIESYGVNKGYTIGNMDIYYPTKVCAKNDPRLVKEQLLTKDKDIKELGNDFLDFAKNDKFAGKLWAKDLQKYANMILLLTRGGIKEESKAKAIETLKGLSALLAQNDGGKSVLKHLVDEGFILDKWEQKAEFIGRLNKLNDKLSLGIDISGAMGKRPGEVYTQGDAMTDAELDYYMFYLNPEKLAKNDASRIAAEESLAYLIALKQLRSEKYEALHAYPPNANEITLAKGDIKRTAAWAKIKEMGIENFLAMGNTPDEIFSSYKQISGVVYNQNMSNLAANNNNKVSAFSGANNADDDDDFSLFKDDKSAAAPKTTEKKAPVTKNDALQSKLRSIDSTTAGLLPDLDGGKPTGSAGNIIENKNAPAPDQKINSIKNTLEAGRNDKISKKAYRDILKALGEFEISYNNFKSTSANPYAALNDLDPAENDRIQNDPYGTEDIRYDAVNTSILDVQEKNRILAETVEKYINAGSTAKDKEAYMLVLESVKTTADDVRYYMDDKQMANDLEHVKNSRRIQDDIIRDNVQKERQRLESKMLRANNDIDRVFLFNKSNALAELSDVALAKAGKNGNGANNELSEFEKQKIAVSIGNLLFDKMCQKFPDMKKKVNTPRTQEQYEAAVDDIMTTRSFSDLLNTLDREGLRHIVGVKSGREDLFKNFIKESYMTKDQAKELSQKKASAAYSFINDKKDIAKKPVNNVKKPIKK